MSSFNAAISGLRVTKDGGATITLQLSAKQWDVAKSFPHGSKIQVLALVEDKEPTLSGENLDLFRDAAPMYLNKLLGKTWAQ